MVAVALLLSAAGCKNDDDDNDVTPQTVTDIIQGDNNFTILEAALQHAGLMEPLRTGTITLFAPNDDAFRASGYADAAAITSLPANTVKDILQYHVINTRNTSSSIQNGDNQEFATLGNGMVYVTKNTSGVSVNGARVVQADIAADNGIIHIIDRVLMPATQNLMQLVQNNNNLSYLVAAATRAASANPAVMTALASTNSAFTVFAPTNQAFMDAGFATMADIQAASPATLSSVILYHVVPGRVFSTNLANGNVTTAATTPFVVDVSNGVRITGSGNNSMAATVTQANMMATNGIVHIIDRVLMPAAPPATPAQ
ncbi:fasciclin domain-containing protein [Telluribacter humicola]